VTNALGSIWPTILGSGWGSNILWTCNPQLRLCGRWQQWWQYSYSGFKQVRSGAVRLEWVPGNEVLGTDKKYFWRINIPSHPSGKPASVSQWVVRQAHLCTSMAPSRPLSDAMLMWQTTSSNQLESQLPTTVIRRQPILTLRMLLALSFPPICFSCSHLYLNFKKMNFTFTFTNLTSI